MRAHQICSLFLASIGSELAAQNLLAPIASSANPQSCELHVWPGGDLRFRKFDLNNAPIRTFETYISKTLFQYLSQYREDDPQRGLVELSSAFGAVAEFG